MLLPVSAELFLTIVAFYIYSNDFRNLNVYRVTIVLINLGGVTNSNTNKLKRQIDCFNFL